MHVLQLNDDVLFSILALSAPLDALRFGMTCRLAHVVAIPHTVRELSLSPRMSKPHAHRLMAYCNLMLAHGAWRMSYLRALTLNVGGHPPNIADCVIPPDLVSLLVDVVRRAKQLTTLTICGSTRLLETRSELMDAFADLPELSTIRLEGCGSQALALLLRTCSRPRNLELIRCDWGQHNPSEDQCINPVLGDAVESMNLQLESSYDLDTGILVQRPCELVTNTVWPAVTALTFHGDANLGALARAFPHLRSLAISGGTYLGAQPADPLWPSLDNVETWSPLNLACPVRRLALRYTPPLSPNFVDLLDRTKPHVLSFNASLDQTTQCQKFGSLFAASEACHGVRYLELFTFRHECGRLDMAGYEIVPAILAYVSAFRAAPLKALAIVFPDPLALGPSGLTRFVQQIAEIVLSLEFVGLRLKVGLGKTGKAVDYEWFRVARCAHPAEIERMSRSEGVRIAQPFSGHWQ